MLDGCWSIPGIIGMRLGHYKGKLAQSTDFAGKKEIALMSSTMILIIVAAKIQIHFCEAGTHERFKRSGNTAPT